ncbi:MAG: hypothetical protein OXK79_01430, partial [Chloroflexota bacterium]|nr:hypothetical protein [Chloroflexota bacterium]
VFRVLPGLFFALFPVPGGRRITNKETGTTSRGGTGGLNMSCPRDTLPIAKHRGVPVWPARARQQQGHQQKSR